MTIFMEKLFKITMKASPMPSAPTINVLAVYQAVVMFEHRFVMPEKLIFWD